MNYFCCLPVLYRNKFFKSQEKKWLNFHSIVSVFQWKKTLFKILPGWELASMEKSAADFLWRQRWSLLSYCASFWQQCALWQSQNKTRHSECPLTKSLFAQLAGIYSKCLTKLCFFLWCFSYLEFPVIPNRFLDQLQIWLTVLCSPKWTHTLINSRINLQTSLNTTGKTWNQHF